MLNGTALGTPPTTVQATPLPAQARHFIKSRRESIFATPMNWLSARETGARRHLFGHARKIPARIFPAAENKTDRGAIIRHWQHCRLAVRAHEENAPFIA
jgi:hypothetical protein